MSEKKLEQLGFYKDKDLNAWRIEMYVPVAISCTALNNSYNPNGLIRYFLKDAKQQLSDSIDTMIEELGE